MSYVHYITTTTSATTTTQQHNTDTQWQQQQYAHQQQQQKREVIVGNSNQRRSHNNVASDQHKSFNDVNGGGGSVVIKRRTDDGHSSDGVCEPKRVLMSEAHQEEDELSLPRSVINKLLKDAAGRIRISADVRDICVSCCNEFVRVLSSKANVNCEKNKKKLIGPDHVLEALDEMGFHAFKPLCLEVMNKVQEEASQRRKRMFWRNTCDSESVERLREEQQELFDQARREQSKLMLQANQIEDIPVMSTDKLLKATVEDKSNDEYNERWD